MRDRMPPWAGWAGLSACLQPCADRQETSYHACSSCSCNVCTSATQAAVRVCHRQPFTADLADRLECCTRLYMRQKLAAVLHWHRVHSVTCSLDGVCQAGGGSDVGGKLEVLHSSPAPESTIRSSLEDCCQCEPSIVVLACGGSREPLILQWSPECPASDQQLGFASILQHP